MANAEVEVPHPTDEILNEKTVGNNGGNNSPISQNELYWTSSANFDEKFDGKQEVDDAVTDEEEWPITYHYLTYETTLPAPNFTARRSKTDAPEPPDIHKFQNPFEWKRSRKEWITWLSCVCTAATAFTAGAYSPGAEQMGAEWHVSRVAILVGICTFTTGFAVAPMVLAPLSEINGRRPVFIATGLLFWLCQVCCAVTKSYGGMLVARFFVGVGGSTFSTMVGGVVSDIYHTKDRNYPMALFSGAALLGTGLGPLACGFIAQHGSWRWMFWMQVIIDGALMGTVIIFFKETRGSILLSRKAKALNAYYDRLEAAGYYGVAMPSEKVPGTTEIQRVRWKVLSDEERVSIARMISISLYRPFHLLVTEPTVFFFSLWISFSWSILYMTFSAIPLIYAKVYHFNISQQGAAFSTISIASIIFTIVCIYQERWATSRGKLPHTPEARLYFCSVQSILLPIGCFLFGWTSRADVHWIVPTVAIALATMGIFSIYLAVFNYLADVYHRYASSALAAQSFCRNCLGGAFPLVTGALFTNLGYGAAGSLLGGIGVLLTFVPWVLVLFGPQIRARSKFATGLAH